MTKYIVRLNNKYITYYNESTGYMGFGDKAEAQYFDTADDALTALVDIVWGGDDEPPEIVEVEK